MSGEDVSAQRGLLEVHFRKRIPVYYSADKDAVLVTTLLDHLAGCNDFVSVSQLLAAAQMQEMNLTKDDLIRILRLMERDHYLQRNDDGLYQFRFELIKRWLNLASMTPIRR